MIRRAAAAAVPRTVTSALISLCFLAGAGMWAWLRVDPFDTGATTAERSTLLLLYSVPSVLPVALLLRRLHGHFSLGSLFGRGLALFALGSAGWALGNGVWFYYQTCADWPVLACGSDVRVPFPSPADALYLSIYPLCTAGGFMVSRALGLGLRQGALACGTFVLSASVILAVGLPPMSIMGVPVGLGFLVADGAGQSQTLLTAAYMVGDTLLLVMAATLVSCARRISRGAFLTPLRLLVVALGLLFLADMSFFHSIATDSYDELGISSLLYASVLAAIPWAIYRFTVDSTTRRASVDSRPSDPWHDAARRVVEDQARLFGDVARHLAAATPGVQVEAGVVTLDAPADQSLRNLVSTFTGRLGRSGDRILHLSLMDASLEHPNGQDLEPLISDIRSINRVVGGPVWSDGVWFAPLVGSTIVGAAAMVSAALIADRHGAGFLLQNAAPAFLAAFTFGQVASRSRRGAANRHQQLEAANDSLGSLLEAFDEARADERTRIAGEVHDFALQQLIGALMHVERAALGVRGDNDGRALESLGRAEELVTGSVAGLRRIMDGLHPSSLLHKDVGSALTELATQVESAYGVAVNVEASAVLDLPLDQQLLVYRTVAELLANAGKHSAASRLDVTARRVGPALLITVRDDGLGFPERLDLLDELPSAHGWGLRLLLQQVTRQGGRLHLRSAPGEGTSVEVLLLLREDPAAPREGSSSEIELGLRG